MTDTTNDTDSSGGSDGAHASSTQHDGRDGRERYKVAGERVVEKLKELLHEGNVQHVVIKNDDGKTLLEIPVTIGVAGALLAPVWAAVGAMAAVVTNCTIEIERQDDA